MKLALATTMIAGLATACAPVNNAPTPRQQQQFAAAIAGRVPGPPQSCLPSLIAQQRIDAGGQLVFGSGGTRYVADTAGGCEAAQDQGNALVIDKFGGSQLCSGDTVRVIDIQSRTLRGVCTIRGFTPYRRP